MTESNRVFGKLLTQGLKSIAAREHKPILALEDELGYEMNATRWSIEKWRQGALPADARYVDYLARACIERASMDKQWLTSFLTQARFLDRDALIQELFPGKGQDNSHVRRNFPGRSYERLI